jgi:hypothetical protein
VLAIVTVPLAASRLFLTVSKENAVWVATGVATLVLLLAIFIALRPKLSKNVVAGIVVVCGIALVTGGIVSAAVGERHIERHGSEHVEQGAGGTQGGGSESGGGR